MPIWQWVVLVLAWVVSISLLCFWFYQAYMFQKEMDAYWAAIRDSQKRKDSKDELYEK